MRQSDMEKTLFDQSLVVSNSAGLPEDIRSFSLSVPERDLLLRLITQIRPEDAPNRMYEFGIDDVCAACGLKGTPARKELALMDLVQRMANKSLWVKLDDERETLLRWIEKVSIDHSNGALKIRFDMHMRLFLFRVAQEMKASCDRPELPEAGSEKQ